MTAAIVRSTYGVGSSGTSSTLTIPAPSSSNTLLVAVELPNANSPIVSVTDNMGNSYVQDFLRTSLNHAGYRMSVFRCTNPVGGPTSIIVTGTTGSFAANMFVQEVSGLLTVNPVSATVSSLGTANGTSSATNTLNLTTLTDNEFAFISIVTNNVRIVSNTTGGFTPAWTTGVVNFNGMSNPNLGVAGSYSSTITLSGGASASFEGVLYKADPVLPEITVGSVTVNNKSGYARVPLTLSAPSAVPVTVDFSSGGGTAAAGLDHVPRSGTHTFAPGETDKFLDFTILE